MKAKINELIEKSKESVLMFGRLKLINEKVNKPSSKQIFTVCYALICMILFVLMFVRYVAAPRTQLYNPMKFLMGLAFYAAVISFFITGLLFLLSNRFIKKRRQRVFNNLKGEIEGIFLKSQQSLTEFYAITDLKINYFNEYYLEELVNIMEQQDLDFKASVRYFEQSTLNENNFRQQKANAKRAFNKLKELEKMSTNKYYLDSYENWDIADV